MPRSLPQDRHRVPLQGAEGAYLFRITHDYTGGIEIVIQGFALAKEFRREEEIKFLDTFCGVFYVERTAVADRDRGFDDHDGIGIDAQDEVYNILNAVGVEVVLDRVIVGRCRDYGEVGIAISRRTIEGGGKDPDPSPRDISLCIHPVWETCGC